MSRRKKTTRLGPIVKPPEPKPREPSSDQKPARERRTPDRVCQFCSNTFSRQDFLEHLPKWWNDDWALMACTPATHCGKKACIWAAFAKLGDDGHVLLVALDRSLRHNMAHGLGNQTIKDDRFF